MTPMRALVTGGTSGIGAAICRRLAADGWRVAVAGRSQERADALAEEIGGAAIVGDVGNPADDTVARAAAALGGLDAVLLNAGVILDADLPSTPAADWDLLMGVNVLAVHRQARAALPYLQATQGSLLITASDAGVWGESAIAAYSIAKRMALTMTRCLAAEWGPAGVRVNAICPGDTAPGMLTTTTGRRTPGATDGWLPPPLGAIVRGEDVAAAAAFLISSDASRITGTGLLIDAGMRSSTTAWQSYSGSEQ